MKIRSGFVSNSSSSSFIIPISEFKNIFDLAKHMIPKRCWEDKDNKLIKSIIRYEENGVDPNTFMCFMSCNYDTYILKENDNYLVATCNNHYWGKKLEDFYDGGDTDNKIYELRKTTNFWFPEFNATGKMLFWADRKGGKFCEKHENAEIIETTDGFKICTECYNVPNSVKFIMGEDNE